jgi:hypothetical protein
MTHASGLCTRTDVVLMVLSDKSSTNDRARETIFKPQTVSDYISQHQPATPDTSIDTYRPSSILESLKPMHSAGGSQGVGSAKTSTLNRRQGSGVFRVARTVPAHIFSENIPPPTVEMKLPGPDERLNNIPQLVCCLGLLKATQSPDTELVHTTEGHRRV